ncbi:MAG TPA: hypothetical protein PKA64_05360 [Myxococcota bacterium]|nr:hypothetical protein [Myxococcota bacterium]
MSWLIVGVALEGCAPSCAQLCTKLQRCQLDGGVSVDECTETCDAQIDLAKSPDAEDGDKKLYLQHRQCVGSSSCDELAAGACYDAELFLFGG